MYFWEIFMKGFLKGFFEVIVIYFLIGMFVGIGVWVFLYGKRVLFFCGDKEDLNIL